MTWLWTAWPHRRHLLGRLAVCAFPTGIVLRIEDTDSPCIKAGETNLEKIAEERADQVLETLVVVLDGRPRLAFIVALLRRFWLIAGFLDSDSPRKFEVVA